VLEDGDDGIDNNVGHHVMGMIKGLMADVETETNTRIASGRYTIVLRLDNVGPSDNARVPGALWLVGERAAPSFAPDEKWPVAGKNMFPLQLFPSGYMRNGVWVSTDSDCAARRSIASIVEPSPDVRRSVRRFRSELAIGPTRMSESTYNRYAISVGTRPAEVCGWKRYPFSSRSLIVFRIVAGDTPSPNRRAIVRDPAGSAVST
jgi:hypothetical protein